MPGMREIKGSVLGRLLYYLVWQLPIALFSFLLFLLHSTFLIIAHTIVFLQLFFSILLSCNFFLYIIVL